MTTITNFRCFFNDKELPTDAFGNNAAFACPNCGHPVLLIASDIDNMKRGIFQDKPSKCRKCPSKFWGDINVEKKEIFINNA